MPRFSIIIATFNRATLLSRAIDSIVKQTFRDWEAVVVDDGSVDNTEQIVNSYRKLNLPISYLYQENQGVAAARNKGLKHAKGEYITFLDSDDWYRPNHLEDRNNILLKNKYVDLLHGGFEVLGDAYVPDKHNPNRKIHLSKCFVGGTMFIKQEVIHKLNGFKKLPLGADSEFFERVKEYDLQIMKTHTPTYIYDRTNGNSITLSFNK